MLFEKLFVSLECSRLMTSEDMDVCCIHYNSTKDENLRSLSSIESWITLNIINVAADLEDGEVPKLMYQKSCRPRYTLKRDLNKLRNEVKESPESKRAKSSEAVSTSTSGVLQKICIFCKKANKFIEDVRENLSNCETFIADKTVRECAILKNDQEVSQLMSFFCIPCYRNAGEWISVPREPP